MIRWFEKRRPRLASESSTKPLDAGELYRAQARFVWLSLQRLGVRRSDLDDVSQEVFIVVVRRLHTFEAGARVESWLFGICVRVAANYRRRAHRRREQGWGANVDPRVEESPHPLIAAPSVPPPDAEAIRRQRLEEAEEILSRLSPVKRAVFVMFQVESMTCDEIARELGLPSGTVHSRLHAARKFFAAEALRREKIGARRW